MMMGKSGLQQQVLSLYRQCIRISLKKPVETRDRFVRHFRSTFREQLGVNPRDFNTIEYLLRRGKAKLKALETPDVTDIQ